MVDYSRIDWAKCKLKPLPCLMADGETKQLTVQAVWDESHGNAVITVSGYHMMAKTGSGSIGWKFLHCNVASTADQALELIERAKEVNSFITTETARIEAEDEAKNWVAVPWQDVEFLVTNNAKVKVTIGGITYGLNVINGKTVVPRDAHENSHLADRRTFPAGYDPEKPRWVAVDSRDVTRLEKAGCAICVRSKEPRSEWVKRFVVYIPPSDSCDYEVDIHTLPPGVPLHEEPKPVPRPCSKEFALSHPKESERRFINHGSWSGMNSWDSPDHLYEFRTTAKAEVKSRIVAEVEVSNLEHREDVTCRDPLEIHREIKAEMKGKLPIVFSGSPEHPLASMTNIRNPRIALIVDEVE